MAAFSPVPSLPAPGKQTFVTITLQEDGANYVRVWVTAAPPNSELRGQLDDAQARNRVQVYEGDGGANAPWSFVPDKGGPYTFAVQEYVKNATAFGGGYQGDPDGAPSETKAGSEDSLTLYVGERVVLPVGAGSDQADLVLWVWNASINTTTKAVHGEDTPAIQASSPTPRMQIVMESSTVASALAALSGITVSDAIGAISTFVSGYITDWNAHLADATVHEGADPDNLLPVGFSIAGNASNLGEFVSEALRKMRQHFTNDPVDGGTDSGRDKADYHNVSGKKNDQTNKPIVENASDAGSAYIGLVDLFRCYTAHAASTAVHDSADATNVLPSTTSAKLFELHRAVLGILASTSPSVPTTLSSGVTSLSQLVGGVATPLE